MRPVSATSSAIRTRASSRSTSSGIGRQDHRHLEALVDPGVELDIHRERVLDVERVAERAGDEQAAAGDREHHVGGVAVGVDRLGELARAAAELLPGHHLSHCEAHDLVRADGDARRARGRSRRAARRRSRRSRRRSAARRRLSRRRARPARDARRARRRSAARRARSGSGSR